MNFNKQSENKDIYLVGINFDEIEKNISKFNWGKKKITKKKI